jgi:hypothetical protein
MYKKIGIIAVLAVLALCVAATGARADDIQTIGEYNGAAINADPGPYDPPTVIGTFNILAGDASATISGFFGNSVIGNSSGVQVFLGSILVGECVEFTACYTTGAAWTDTLSAAQLASLGTGPVNVTAVQTSQFVVRLGVTTLDQVPAPEPGSMALLGVGILGLAAVKFAKR